MVKQHSCSLWLLALASLAKAHEVSILPDARLEAGEGLQIPTGVATQVVPQTVQTRETVTELPETVEDVEARWLGMALSQVGWVLSESPLSLGQKATSFVLSAEKQEHERSPHQTMALTILSMLGVSVAREHRHMANPSGGSIPLHPHTMFGGIPWLLIIPIVLGVVLASVIQVVSLYSEWSDAKEKIARGEPLDPEPIF
mmetsp:Transcript_9473/g.17568  ORF Transcript_9473/g.17568 Transcript_9473/m.17568 type:complete len:200 (+) Transcript_9473:126-725(+)